MNNTVIFLCSKDELTRERRGYFKAFSKKVHVLCIPSADAGTYEKLENLTSSALNPIFVLQPDSYPRRLPQDLARSLIPTGCFNIDTFESINRRIHFSMLFDYAFVFHPGYEVAFQAAGHPRAIFLSHAVEADLFAGEDLPRIYEVGWVGRMDGSNYSTRRRCIQKLNALFKMNDITQHHSPEEMALVYRQSKIVVNLSRDDYLQDANLRCFEVMASGALLIAPNPTEIADIGFIEGVHYISYKQESELVSIIQHYIDCESDRQRIANAGRELVFQKHTYDCHVKTILDLLTEDKSQFFAPARKWEAAKIHQLYAQYFADNLLLDAAIRELQQIRKCSHSRKLLWETLPSVIKAFLVQLKMLF
jgi:Glycosyl transferases group 1